MARMDDLVPLLVPSSSSDVGFASGTVESWSSQTGENTVRVAGALLTNVPILNTGEAISLRAGHVVAMLRFKSSYFILGRVVIPGSDQFAGSALAFESLEDVASDFNVPQASVAKPCSVTIDVPAWCKEVAISATVNTTLRNTRAAADWAVTYPIIDGDAGTATLAGFAPNGNANRQDYGALSGSQNKVITNPPATITVEGAVQANDAGWSANTTNHMYLSVFASFRASSSS